MTIEITRTRDGYHACIEGKPAYQGSGKNSYEAAGSLILAHKEMFGIKIIEIAKK